MAVRTLGIAVLVAVALAGAARGQTFGDGLAAFESAAFADAAAIWAPLADAGDLNAQYGLGRLYQRGLGVARDLMRSVQSLSRAPELEPEVLRAVSQGLRVMPCRQRREGHPPVPQSR